MKNYKSYTYSYIYTNEIMIESFGEINDFLKAFIPVLVVRYMFHDTDLWYLYGLYAGLGVVLGHNFPFWMHFRGGTGIAGTSPPHPHPQPQGAGYRMFLAPMGGGRLAHPSPMAYGTRRSIEC